MAQVFTRSTVKWFVPFVCWASYCLVPESVAQVLGMDTAGGVTGGSVYVFRLNSRYELSVPTVEDVQKVLNWLNSGEVKENHTSESPHGLDHAIGDFLKTRPQPTGQYLAVSAN